jgi:hypothetical protein
MLPDDPSHGSQETALNPVAAIEINNKIDSKLDAQIKILNKYVLAVLGGITVLIIKFLFS